MIALGSDHGGYLLKNYIIDYLKEMDMPYKDYGCYNEDSCDYTDFAKSVARAVADGECEHGILVCSTGIGISMTANKFDGVRCALCHDLLSARLTREHNNANILALGQLIVGRGLALEIVKTFIHTDFSNEERHVRRVHKINQL